MSREHIWTEEGPVLYCGRKDTREIVGWVNKVRQPPVDAGVYSNGTGKEIKRFLDVDSAKKWVEQAANKIADNEENL